jgi:hypothetical protein
MTMWNRRMIREKVTDRGKEKSLGDEPLSSVSRERKLQRRLKPTESDSFMSGT